MLNQHVSIEHDLVSVQVWTQLTAELRARVILLMAQLAFNLVLAQTDLLVKEPNYVESTCSTQNPV